VTDFAHRSVLLDEVLDALEPRSGGVYVDATVGGGGHAEGILTRGGEGTRLFAFDRDESALAAARERLASFGDQVTFVHSAFGDVEAELRARGVDAVDGVLADLGVSSPQLDRAERGFSFGQDGPLDMRMDPSKGETALELVARLELFELANVIFELGEERRSRRIARSIHEAYDADELSTTSDLRAAIHRVTGGKRAKRDPATRTFQALRMAVNDELGQLEALLEALPRLLVDGGVAVLISFHSLEDRPVKWYFRRSTQLVPLSKRPVIASDDEQRENPRSRSAKLRAARRLPRSEAA